MDGTQGACAAVVFVVCVGVAYALGGVFARDGVMNACMDYGQVRLFDKVFICTTK
jgi:hypothetical protein